MLAPVALFPSLGTGEKAPFGVPYNELTEEEKAWVWPTGQLLQYVYTRQELLAAVPQPPRNGPGGLCTQTLGLPDSWKGRQPALQI